jgi:serine/threonine-protein kinase RsbW
MTEHVVRLSFPAKADYLLLARLTLAGLARSLPVGPELLADLKLAVTEACGNAVRHAYDAGEGSVELELVVTNGRLDMIVEDQGSGLSVPVERLVSGEPAETVGRDQADGGMGMAIIRAIVDELEVREGVGGRGTVVHMTKYLDQAAPTGESG